MRVIFYDTKPYDRSSFERENEKYLYEFKFLESKLTADTAALAKGYDIACAFVNDDIGAETIDALLQAGIKALVMRCSGYNNVDMKHAHSKHLRVLRVPRYSPYAVAEHAMALLLSVNRRTHRAYLRTRDSNFSLNGLLGFDLHDKTVGIIGTGRIGQCFIQICKGFGMHILAYDRHPNVDADYDYVELDRLLQESDIISLHCPLTPETKHLICAERLAKCKPGVVIINTSRGALIHSQDLIDALKSGKVGAAGLDVYEEESELFFEDHSAQGIQDDQLLRLISFNNVLITSHQAFFTREALSKIAEVTLFNIAQVEKNAAVYDNEIIYRAHV